MAYTKTVWKDRVVEKPRNYTKTDNADGSVTLTPAPGVVTEAGTPIIAANLNNIEQGIEGAYSQLAEKMNNSKGTEMDKFEDLFLGSYSNFTNGYTKLTNGIIIQWGKINVPASAIGWKSSKVTFPITFPSFCRNMSCTPRVATIAKGTLLNVEVYNDSVSSFDLEYQVTSSQYAYDIFWFAIGC